MMPGRRLAAPAALRRATTWVLCVAVCGACAGPTAASSVRTVLLRDDFDGVTLNSGLWTVPTGAGTFLGRTQIRPPSQPPQVANGLLRLALNTFNPTATTPGDSFWGSEIDSIQTFPVGTGLAFKASVRLETPVPAGLVGSVFGYVLDPGGTTHDEIDVELLTGSPAQFLTNVYQAASFASAGNPVFAAGDISAFHTYEVDWYPDHVAWLFDGQQVRAESTVVPTQSLSVRMNFWAPSSTFAQAYNAAFQPTASQAQDQTFFYDVDFVEVDALGKAVATVVPAGLKVMNR